MTYALHSASVRSGRSSRETNRVVSLERRLDLRRQSSVSPSRQRRPTESVVIPLHAREQLRQQRSSARSFLPLPWLRRSSTLISALLATSTLTVYGGTVYSQQQWHDATRELEQLRQQERQLVIATEALRQNVMELEQHNELENLAIASEQTLYLTPAPQRPSSASPSSEPPSPSPAVDFPLGY
ncbi:hypothetical protein E1H12_02290 [Geitlerinema sp. P-1104]|uniref:hypothetical protein n=1 Tax=Geitlerinema sp. P-1104 TaxID=2546230 RepID=UPI0014768B52|nr:hypothetical protein [Geitlerinema sp. P-1104]NMG57375.1 hypothetical protein [Geitlerinema sp. P-1104]